MAMQTQLRAGYHVKSGDSLSSIAQEQLGDQALWPTLYDLNREEVGPNPDRIFEGQRLQLPENECSPDLPLELQTSEDFSRLSDSALDDRVAEGLVALDDYIRLPVQHALAWEQRLAELQREKLRREGFDALTDGETLDEPAEEIALPPEVIAAMQKGWDESFPGGRSKERGGIFVEDAGLEFKESKKSTSDEISINYHDQDPHETLIATGHTHPYDETEGGGPENVSFSGVDLARLVTAYEPVQIVQSGKTLFLVARSPEFEAYVATLDDKGKKQLSDDIESTYDQSRNASKLPFVEQVEEAVQLVCRTYGLVYYRGSADALQLQETI